MLLKEASTSLMSTKLFVFRAPFAREEELTVRFQKSFMSHKCDLQDSRGVNVVTYLWDNI